MASEAERQRMQSEIEKFRQTFNAWQRELEESIRTKRWAWHRINVRVERGQLVMAKPEHAYEERFGNGSA